MSSFFKFTMGLAVAAVMAGFVAPAAAGAPDHCTFTSPASIVCPSSDAVAWRAPARQPMASASADHCVATSPASIACPSAPVAVAVAAADTRLRLSSK